ncbi:hypothetical protein H0H81_011439 [Sphagnurus paluster]|uniref:Uncharacterized protein n=1 Tax=Sphagnurus paluster TaxID=117069 RepID=A0A9P7GN46_9AGAR|nr:hypothetical protein H0H81_011439 [Sphagnurus paluster]
MFDLIQNIIQPIIWFATAPLTAVLHLIIGHAILHAANPHSSTWSPSLQSTASAGAVGGTILGVPLVPLYIYLALLEEERLENYRLEHPADDSVEVCTMFHSFTSLMEWAARGAILVGGGCAAGALGVVCLRDTGTRMGICQATIRKAHELVSRIGGQPPEQLHRDVTQPHTEAREIRRDGLVDENKSTPEPVARLGHN